MLTDASRPLVLLIDETTEFALRLTQSVNRGWSEHLNMKQADSLSKVSEHELRDVSICLFSHAHAAELETRRWPEKTAFFLLCDETDERKVSRYLPLSEFVTHIAGSLTESPLAPARRAVMDMVLGFDRHARDRYVRKAIQKGLAAGHTVYFMPLMPTYLIPDAELSENGDTLSDLLLALETGIEVTEKHLGHVCFMHSKGYFQPRLPERADDLISAEPETLERLILLLRARLEKSGPEHTALIACDSLPLDTVGRLAAHCDTLALDVPGTDMSALTRQDIDLMLTTLPSSCHVRETVDPQ